MQFVIMFVGLTHSGKTTSGRKLLSELPKCVLLDSDAIAEFLADNFALLHQLKAKENLPGRFAPDLKQILRMDILAYALTHGFNVILTNSHLEKKSREPVTSLAKDYQAKVILIYLKAEEATLRERIKTANKSRKVLRSSPDFLALLEKENKFWQEPEAEETDFFLEFSEKDDFSQVLSAVKKIIA